MKRRINHYASFKDPSAKVFYLENDEKHIYRQLDSSYLKHYRHFQSSGLAAELIRKNLLIHFEEVSDSNETILKAEKIHFVSYPYEWTFNQWKDAALVMLKVQFHALRYGMTLKDATPFNIVFKGAKPIFVDISSFEVFESKPWKAFKQFSENLYLPVLLHKYFNGIANNIYLNNSDGISLDKGFSLLPISAKYNLNNLIYLTIPNRIRNQKHPDSSNEGSQFSQKKSMDLTQSLFKTISKIKQRKKATKWNTYYQKNVDAAYLKEKMLVVENWLKENYLDKIVIDYGCNTGNLSLLLSPYVKEIIAFDEDIFSVDDLYIKCKENKVSNVYIFAANISAPTPATGWNNQEHATLIERLKGDIGLALALIHHLAITNYIQFNMMAELFAKTSNELIIEFVPKTDEKVQLLLSTREDIFSWYTYENFISDFEKLFSIEKKYIFKNGRILLHFIKK